MNVERLEIFTDGVIAIIITILVLELHEPETASLSAIWDLKFNYLGYATSFLICALLWKQHHHLFRKAERINEKVVWINTALIFCITFIPYLTVFAAENVDSILAEGVYGLFFLLIDFVYFILYRALVSINPENKDNIDALARKNYYPFTIIILLFGFAAGVFFYPPVIMISCLLSLLIWMIPNKQEKIILN